MIEFVCTVPISHAVQRISTRTASTSDATAGIAAALGESAQPWPEAHPIDTSIAVPEVVSEMERLCRLAG